jgi:hypothetical protein
MGASNYAYNIPEQDEWKTRSDNEADKFIDSLDAASVRRLAERAIASDAEKEAADRFYNTTVPLFKKMYPAYIDSDHNAQLMKHHFETAFGVAYPSLVQVEESFFALRNSGVLNLNKAAIAKEDAAELAKRHDEVIAARKEAEFDPAVAYTMSMEELERRAGGRGR